MSIKHIEDLRVDDFINAIADFSKFVITEKLDGYNLRFGFDNVGLFYIDKRTKRYYDQESWENIPANNGHRSAHAALAFIEPQLRKVLNNGEAVEAEILYGRQPNAIVYDQSYISFIRVIVGDNNCLPDPDRLHDLRKQTTNLTIATSTLNVHTEYGRYLKSSYKCTAWKFVPVPTIDITLFNDIGIEANLKSLNSFLHNTQQIWEGYQLSYYKLLTTHLNKIPKEYRKEAKEIRNTLNKTITKLHKLPIKEKLLNATVRKITSGLRNTPTEEDFGIEGIVFLDPETQKQFKLVDKEVFTTINNFNFAIRNELKNSSFSSKKRVNGVTLGVDKNDFYGKVLKELDLILDIVGPIDDIKKRMRYRLLKTLGSLEHLRCRYIDERKYYSITLKTGKRIKYTDEIHNRTLITFAEIHDKIANVLEGLTNINTEEELEAQIHSMRSHSVQKSLH